VATTGADLVVVPKGIYFAALSTSSLPCRGTERFNIPVETSKNKKGRHEVGLFYSMASPRVLPVYPSLYLLLKKHYDFFEFYPFKRYRKPLLLRERSVIIKI
jgi:hypothetical protein